MPRCTPNANSYTQVCSRSNSDDGDDHSSSSNNNITNM